MEYQHLKKEKSIFPLARLNFLEDIALLPDKIWMESLQKYGNVQFQKKCILWGGSVRPKIKKCIKLNWNFQRCGVGPFCRGGMDNFWNYTIINNLKAGKWWLFLKFTVDGTTFICTKILFQGQLRFIGHIKVP